jgi:hypothetical protein
MIVLKSSAARCRLSERRRRRRFQSEPIGHTSSARENDADDDAPETLRQAAEKRVVE